MNKNNLEKGKVTNMTKERINELISQMTLEEKAGLLSGEDFWRTKKIERLGIPQIMVSDGPHGLRKQNDAADNLGVNESIKAVAFPAGCAGASSFNREVLYKVGETLGEECQAEGVATILGPGVCIKRSPLCGRNFEYFSEDPLVASESATAIINGIQSKGVGTSIKHFLANSQEHRRFTSTSDVDERALREIYLASFEGAIKNAKPWTVMCSYNKINGTYASNNKKYLTDILRDEWGYEGIVMSDWGAVSDRVAGVAAGLDLEMPASHGTNDALVVKAVKEGKLSEADVDKCVARLLDWIFKATENAKGRSKWDLKEHHKKAMEAAKETIVLLKNDENILPLNKGSKVAFIGKYAESPRFQGGGSSHINTLYVTGATEAAKELGISGVTYTKGFDDKEDVTDEALIKEAVEAAKAADVAVIFAGLPDSFESEGFDRKHMRMPDCQNALISAVAAAQPNTVVVLHNGAPVEMPWIGSVKGVLEAYLSGEGVGMAEVQILYGDVNPSAKLAETFPLKLEDNPSFLFYSGEGDRTEYREGIYVGYRYYDKKKMDVLFPFGHGLSYTNFEYSNLKLDKQSMDESEELTVSVDITNTGKVFGKEVVQLYVKNFDNEFVMRPVKELRGYDKVALEPGETKTVTFKLGKRAFAYYDTGIGDWFVESGEYEILIAASSRDIRLSAPVKVTGLVARPFNPTVDTMIGDFNRHAALKAKMAEIIDEYYSLFDSEDSDGSAKEALSEEMMELQYYYSPIRSLVPFSFVKEVSMEDVAKMVEELKKLL